MWTGPFLTPKSVAPSRIHVDHALATEWIASSLREQLLGVDMHRQSIVVLCIGTDRSTGDALGPLVGSELHELSSDNIHVYGTLDEPVHAANLVDTLERVRSAHPEATIIAVDACLGKAENVGCISVKSGPLRPGTGVNKKLPEVGDCHVIGVVNVGGFMEYFVLQNTRLSLVVRMARAIAQGFRQALGSEWVGPQAQAAAYREVEAPMMPIQPAGAVAEPGLLGRTDRAAATTKE